MVSRVGVSEDFRKEVLGYGLTTAQILYRMPDQPSLFTNLRLAELRSVSEFPGAEGFSLVLAAEARGTAVLRHRCAFETH